MPGRWVSASILLFWVVVNGWFIYKDILPRWLPGQPPPYHIDLTAEAMRERPPISWKVYQKLKRKGKEPAFYQVFRAETKITHEPETDIFELHALFREPMRQIAEKDPVRATIGPLQLTRMESLYRINQNGDLLAIKGSVNGTGLGATFKAIFSGEVRDGKFHPQLTVEAPLLQQVLGQKPFQFQPVPVSSRGSVLLPLHPVNRIQGLRRGQTWDIPTMDPVAAATASTGESSGQMRILHARVLKETKPLMWKRRERQCLVIEYQDTDETMWAQTWVEEKTGLVLRQEARHGSEHWRLQRE